MGFIISDKTAKWAYSPFGNFFVFQKGYNMDNRIVPTKVRHILLVTNAGAYPTVKIVLFVFSVNELRAVVDVAHPHIPPYRSAAESFRIKKPKATARAAGTKTERIPAITI